MLCAEITVTPVVTEDLQKYIDIVLAVVSASGMHYEEVPMGAVVYGSLSDVLDVAHECHNAVKCEGIDRVLTEIRIDDDCPCSVETVEQNEDYPISI